MRALPSNLRRDLERVVIQARDLAEDAARRALLRHGVDAAKPYPHFTEDEQRLRNRLRARGRQVGDLREPNEPHQQAIDALTHELAYEYWHRMIFARFLAENHLLMHPDGVPVTLRECDELARSENALNGYVLAARYASAMLPEIFRSDDVLLDIEFPANDRLPLERLLESLPPAAITADDSLGWVYQFWQSKRKKEVNASGDKIDGRTLPAVTQLFTEDYMVSFLLQNTLGAWWAARRGITGPANGAGIPAGQSPVAMPYLRWREDGSSAAGTFDGLPLTLREFRLLDPCCGSGHFLVAAFRLLVPLRMEEEGLSAEEACDAVLRDNLHGLELDSRCAQIAAFALALAAWTHPDERGRPLGWRPLPALHIACSGLGVAGNRDEWLALANGDEKLKGGMDRLYTQFSKASELGSLIDPRRETGSLLAAGYAELAPLLEQALRSRKSHPRPALPHQGGGEEEAEAIGVRAQGMAKAAELLASTFHLVATNVPYLGRGKQDDFLKQYCEAVYPDAKADLATCFVERCLSFCAPGGTAALVTPQNWLFLGTYKNLRKRLLEDAQWDFVARLGEKGFESPQAAGAFTALLSFTRKKADETHAFAGLDVAAERTPAEKDAALREKAVVVVGQNGQLGNPDGRITVENLMIGPGFLHQYANAYQGLKTGDNDRFILRHWEVDAIRDPWRPAQTSPESTLPFAGCTNLIRWQDQGASMARLQGLEACAQIGVGLGTLRSLPTTIFLGSLYDSAIVPLVPKDRKNLNAIVAFCFNDAFRQEIRKIDAKLAVTTATFIKVPFDLAHWQKVAAEKYPNGLPKPHSDDPTQWLFDGHPKGSEAPLLVAVARLLGYRWPRQTGSSFPDCPALEPDGLERFADADGIVPIPAVRGESPASERLAELLRAAYGSEWSPGVLDRLLTDAGWKSGATLEDWLRDGFFEAHCKLFHQRPFVWQVWDGRRDGFSCLVNYHKLDYRTLENLTYSYLQDWINAQAADARAGRLGADMRLQAARVLQDRLKLILEGEPPYDIFVRWKPVEEQSIGWNPDINDGVRLNIRPFVEAGVLRKNPNVNWKKDRGKDPESAPWFRVFKGERINDHHLPNAEKQAARGKAKGG